MLLPGKKLLRKRKSAIRQAQWDKENMSRVLHEIQKARFQAKAGEDVPEPPEVAQLVGEVKSRIDALGE